MDIRKTRKRKIDINIAPLIDVVFLLLIFFMLSYHFVINPGLKLTLPQADTATKQQDKLFTVYITKDDEIYVNEKEVSLEDLFLEIETNIDKYDKKAVVIKADEKIDLGLTVQVMDISKKAGADSLIISTQKKQEK